MNRWDIQTRFEDGRGGNKFVVKADTIAGALAESAIWIQTGEVVYSINLIWD